MNSIPVGFSKDIFTYIFLNIINFDIRTIAKLSSLNKYTNAIASEKLTEIKNFYSEIKYLEKKLNYKVRNHDPMPLETGLRGQFNSKNSISLYPNNLRLENSDFAIKINFGPDKKKVLFLDNSFLEYSLPGIAPETTYKLTRYVKSIELDNEKNHSDNKLINLKIAIELVNENINSKNAKKAAKSHNKLRRWFG